MCVYNVFTSTSLPSRPLHCLFAGASRWFFPEAVLKLLGYGPKDYFSAGWNRFDFLIVLSSFVGYAFRLPRLQLVWRYPLHVAIHQTMFLHFPQSECSHDSAADSCRCFVYLPSCGLLSAFGSLPHVCDCLLIVLLHSIVHANTSALATAVHDSSSLQECVFPPFSLRRTGARADTSRRCRRLRLFCGCSA